MAAASRRVLLFLTVVASCWAQDNSDCGPPERSTDLQNLQKITSLASRMDKLLQPLLPRKYDGRFLLPGYGASELIGVRGNFDEEPETKPGQPGPLHVMRNNDLGAPLLPTQWQIMAAPFVMLLPDVTDFCHCRGMANCGCCAGFMIKPLGIRNNVCLNASLTKDAYSTSQYMLHARVHYDTYKIVDISVSEKQPPMVCLSIVPFSNVAACLRLADLYRDAVEEKVCTCFAISLQLKDKPVITIPSGCFCVGKPVPDSKKSGLFGLNLGTLLYSVQELIG